MKFRSELRGSVLVTHENEKSAAMGLSPGTINSKPGERNITAEPARADNATASSEDTLGTRTKYGNVRFSSVLNHRMDTVQGTTGRIILKVYYFPRLENFENSQELEIRGMIFSRITPCFIIHHTPIYKRRRTLSTYLTPVNDCIFRV